jgi:regulator of replication initiation timing
MTPPFVAPSLATSINIGPAEAGHYDQKERTGMIKSSAARTSQSELDPIDRLEDKIKRLVDLIAQMRADQAKAAEANARLGQEITALRARLADAESATTEMSALRDEREMIRTRVADMLEQLEAI